MEPEQIFLIVWAVVMVCLISTFIIRGRKSLQKFPELEKSAFEYVENSASGYSTQSFKTRMGGAQNVLRIRVTKDELWLTSNTLMAWILDKYDLLHLISIKSLKSVESEGNNINIAFDKSGQLKEVVIMSKRQNELIQLLKYKMKHNVDQL